MDERSFPNWDFLQFPHKIVAKNFLRSYLPQYSSDLHNLKLHRYLLEKSFPTVPRLPRSDTRFENYAHFKLLPLKNPGIILHKWKLLCWHAMGCVGPMLDVQGMLIWLSFDLSSQISSMWVPCWVLLQIEKINLTWITCKKISMNHAWDPTCLMMHPNDKLSKNSTWCQK